jgi:Zn-dependent protease with chaperone function
MKKFTFVIIILLLTSCAHQKTTYVAPQDIRYRANPIFRSIYNCMNLYDDGYNAKLFIDPSKTTNGWVDGSGNVTLNEGLFKYDDDVIKFVVAHELAHVKLHHVRNQRIVSVTTTTLMVAANFILPGIGLLNHAVNPLVTNNFNKTQESDADRLAVETGVSCLGLSVDRQIHVLESLQRDGAEDGGLWAAHPSWDDRISNIKDIPH